MQHGIMHQFIQMKADKFKNQNSSNPGKQLPKGQS